MNMKLLSSVIFASMLVGACASPSSPDSSLLGSPAPATAATRTIVITPNTRWANVTGGEIIKFVVADNTFTWNFNNSITVDDFDLRQVAPPGVFDHQVEVYIAPNPLYIGSGGGHGGGHGGTHR